MILVIANSCHSTLIVFASIEDYYGKEHYILHHEWYQSNNKSEYSAIDAYFAGAAKGLNTYILVI